MGFGIVKATTIPLPDSEIFIRIVCSPRCYAYVHEELCLRKPSKLIKLLKSTPFL